MMSKYHFSRFEWVKLDDSVTSPYTRVFSFYEGWNFNSGNYLFTTDTK